MQFDELEEKMIKKIRRKANEYSISEMELSELCDIFFDIIMYETGEQKLEDKTSIIDALKTRYLNVNIDCLNRNITTLSIKIESFIKKINVICGNNVGGMFAALLKDMFRNKVKLSNDIINHFFEADSNKKPVYSHEYFKNKMLFGEHMKIAYDTRNMEGHNNFDYDDDVAMSTIDSLVLAYLAIVYYYKDSIADLVSVHKEDNEVECYQKLQEQCSGFDNRNSYILITDKFNIEKNFLTYLANICWDLIFDFDKNSLDEGLYLSVHEEYEKNRAIIRLINSDNTCKLSSKNTTFWTFALGQNGVSNSLVSKDSYMSWQKKYGEYINEIIKQYSLISRCNTIIVLIKCKKKQFVIDIIMRLYNMFNNRVRFVFVNDKNQMFDDIIFDKELICTYVDISEKQLLKSFDIIGNQFEETNKISIPSVNELGKIEIDDNEVQLIRRFFDIVHLNIAESDEENFEGEKSFYQGREITWREIEYGYAAKRYSQERIYNDIEGFLSNRSIGGIITVYHAPGAGGTTLGKMLAYQLSRKYPTLKLNYYDKDETVEEIHRCFSLTNSPILIYVDNDVITQNEITELSDLCETKYIKCAFLVIRRSFSNLIDEKNHQYYLDSKIISKESSGFKRLFSNLEADKTNIVKDIFLNNNPREMTPFYIGLCVYEKEYLTISEYVKRRIDNSTNKQKKLLSFLALYTTYGQYNTKALPSYIFKNYVGEKKEYVILDDYLNGRAQKDLIIACEDLSWRIIHPIISEEILLQILGKNDEGDVNPKNLHDLAREFIDIIYKEFPDPTEEILDILRGLFILRDDFNVDDDEEIIPKKQKNKFSRLINAVRYADYQISILKYLTDKYPKQEPHFWGHLGRAYSMNEKMVEAILALDKGITLIGEEDKQDFFILYHIKGMCYRKRAYVIKDNYTNNYNTPDEKITDFQKNFELAATEFSNARKYAVKVEHGYVSHIQMVIQTIEFLYSIKRNKYERLSEFLKSSDGKWVKEKLSEALEIIDFYYDKVKGKPDNNMQILKLKISKYYDDGDMISQWYDLLGKSNGEQLNYIRRNIAYAYLARHRFIWSELSQKELNSIEKYLLQNIHNHPEKRDVFNWVTAARLLSKNTQTIINVLEKSLFYNETEDTYFYLYCYYLVEFLNGSEFALQKCNNYKGLLEKCSDGRRKTVYCPEWITTGNDGKYRLVKTEEIGQWDRENSFFENNEPTRLKRINGVTIKILSKSQGFIELMGLGINVFYVPGAVQHYKTNLNQKVNFYLGINYDGMRAFKVKEDL